MKAVNIFYLVIYWTQKAHSDLIFLCSLHCVPYKCSSASEAHGYLCKKIILAQSSATRAQPATPLRRTWDLPPIASLSGPKTLKSLGARSGGYGGCGRHSKERSWVVVTAERAVWGRALSCWSKTPVLRRPRCLDLTACRRRFFGRSAYVALVCVPPGHVVLQNYPSFIPKENQQNLSRRWLCAEFFQFWWGDMAPFLARFQVSGWW